MNYKRFKERGILDVCPSTPCFIFMFLVPDFQLKLSGFGVDAVATEQQASPSAMRTCCEKMTHETAVCHLCWRFLMDLFGD